MKAVLLTKEKVKKTEEAWGSSGVTFQCRAQVRYEFEIQSNGKMGQVSTIAIHLFYRICKAH